MTINFLNYEFKNLKEFKFFISDILKNELDKEIRDDNQNFKILSSLFKRHPNYDTFNFSAEDIIFFKPKYNVYKKIELSVFLNNKTWDVFSYPKCISNKKDYKKEDLLKAFRSSINNQIFKFKLDNKINKCCSECGSNNNLHVDHIIDFQILLCDFLKNNKLNLPYTFDEDLITKTKIFKKEDSKIKNNWDTYHYQNCKLRWLCCECNLKRKKFNNASKYLKSINYY